MFVSDNIFEESSPAADKEQQIESLIASANQFVEKRAFQEAKAAYKQVLLLSAEHPLALFGLGMLAYQSKQFSEAEKLFERAAKANPKDAMCFYFLGTVLKELFVFEKAVEAFLTTTTLHPAFAPCYYQLASCYEELRKPEKSLDMIRKAVELEPDNVHYLHDYCLHLQNAGQHDASKQVARELIAKAGDDAVNTYMVGRAYYFLAGSEKYKPGESDDFKAELLHKAEAFASSGQASAEIYFALGKLCNDRNEYKEAYRYYEKANTHTLFLRKPFPWDDYARELESILSVMTPEFIQSRKAWGSESKRPIFVVGMPRTGTSLLDRILGAHPDVFGAGELRWIPYIANTVTQRYHNTNKHHSKVIDSFKHYHFLDMAQIYLDKLSACNDDAKHVVDKLPVNSIHCGLIHMLFPNAKIIHMQRNPMDVFLSMYFQHFSAVNYTNRLDDIVQWYIYCCRAMDHYTAAMPEAIHPVRYEALIAHPRETVKALLDACDLEWDEACMEYYKRDAMVNTASKWQVRQPIYDSSVKRYEHYLEYIPEPVKSEMLKHQEAYEADG